MDIRTKGTSDFNMSRRRAIERLALLAGITLSVPVTGFLSSGCTRVFREVDDWSPGTLSQDDLDLVAAIAERIIPETDTPGAREAHVHRFVDLMLTDWYSADESEHFMSGLAGLRTEAFEKNQVEFVEWTEEQQVSLLEELESRELAERELENPPERPGFFRTMKQLTLVGYYTSEIGATQELRYLAVPVKYDGCMTVDEVGRAWS